MRSFYKIMLMATSDEMGNIAPRAGIEPTFLGFWASALTITPPRLPDVTALPMPTCLYVALPEMSVPTPTLLNTDWSANVPYYHSPTFVLLFGEVALISE